jgi:hypothetical protein
MSQRGIRDHLRLVTRGSIALTADNAVTNSNSYRCSQGLNKESAHGWSTDLSPLTIHLEISSLNKSTVTCEGEDK